jgi:hypothetical protein
MFLYSGKLMFLVPAGMKGYTLVLVIYFYDIRIIDHIYLLADILVGHTIVVIVLSQGDVIVFLHLGLYLVF